MDNAVDAESARQLGLLGVRVDSDDVVPAGTLGNDAREEAVTTAEVEAAAARQGRSQHVGDLDGTPDDGRRLERIVANEALQESGSMFALLCDPQPQAGRVMLVRTFS